VPQLCAVLRDDETGRVLLGVSPVPHRSREAAAVALGLAGRRTARDDERTQAVRGLLAGVREAGAKGNWELQVACAIALRLVSASADEIEILLECLASNEMTTEATVHAPLTLARLLTRLPHAERRERLRTRLVDLLAKRLTDKREPAEFREGVILALGELGGVGDTLLDARIRSLLRGLASGGSFSSRRIALRALANTARDLDPAAPRPDGLLEIAGAFREELLDGEPLLRRDAILAAGLFLQHLPRRVDLRACRPTVRRALDVALLDLLAEPDALTAAAAGGPHGPGFPPAPPGGPGPGATPGPPGPSGPPTPPGPSPPGRRDVGDASRGPYGAIALGGGGTRDVSLLAALRRGILPGDAAIEGDAMLALGLTGDFSTADRMWAVLVDDAADPLHHTSRAAITLALLGEPGLQDALVDLVARSGDLKRAAMAAGILEVLGGEPAVDPLLRVLRDPRAGDVARAGACRALGGICDTREEPWREELLRNLDHRAITVGLREILLGLD